MLGSSGLKDQSTPKDHTPNVLQIKRAENVSKVMLNVSQTVKNNNDATGVVRQDVCENASAMEETSITNDGSSVSKKKKTYSMADETFDSHSSRLNGNFRDLNERKNSLNGYRMNIDHDDLSKQVNEIIDEAAEINEAKLNEENNQKSKESAEDAEEIIEINNNNQNETLNHNQYEKYSICNQRECEASIKNQKINTDRLKVNSTEAPIQPILNETRTFNFHECSESSLPTSTTSTLNTMAILSTGPESLITSDIEDGYKGNEVEKNRNIGIVNQEDSKEDFIESQFEFLHEHLEKKTDLDPDEEKTFDFNKRSNLISSTMIVEKINETYDVSPSSDKIDVINELTEIINCNRLETFIKPNHESNSSVESRKRSSLSNFQISAYSKTNKKKDKSNMFSGNYSVEGQNLDKDKKVIKELTNTIQKSQSIPLETFDSNKQGDTFTISIPKHIGRSMSFHSTSTLDQENLNSTMEQNVSSSELRNSYLSSNKMPEPEIHKSMNDANHRMYTKSGQESSSELTIRDTPSLQSIEVMKSILNKSNLNLDRSTDVQNSSVVGKKVTDGDFQKKHEKRQEKSDVNVHMKPETSESSKRAYKYQGPPAINFSTWGERPKSMVHIKSDSDYILGGNSKIAALQRRFDGDGDYNGSINSGGDTSIKKEETHCELISCKLPIVRGVEYKKNIEHKSLHTIVGDVADSKPTRTSLRPSYEISRIGSETPSYNFQRNKTNTDSGKESPKSIQNNYSGVVQRVQSFNSLIENRSMNQYRGAKEKVGMNEPERIICTRFTLKKTGLKEKRFNTSNSKANDSIGTELIENELKNNATEMNPIPTAPKPPLIFKRTGTRSISMGQVQLDPKNQLLDSIRNFNKDTLKRKGIH